MKNTVTGTELEKAKMLKMKSYDEGIEAFQNHIDFCLSEIENLRPAAQHMKPAAELIQKYQEQIVRMQAAIDFRKKEMASADEE